MPFAAPGETEEKLFNGKDLSGWDGDSRLWSVVDGISARGNVVKHFGNGELAAVITDNDPAKRSLKGILALQLHAGPVFSGPAQSRGELVE